MTNKGVTGIIEEALQTIQFKLDNKGGKIKSEAAISAKLSAIVAKQRHFNFDGNFAIFLKETEKEKPYFAANVDNILLFQK